ncbi:MFS transporter, partial [Streptomyces hydrogenans]
LDAASLAKLPEALREAYQHAVAAGTHSAFLVGSAVAVLGFVLAFFVKEVALRGAGPAPAERPADEDTTKVAETV